MKQERKTRGVGTYKAVAVGASAGGNKAVAAVLSSLPADFPLPIVIVQHVHPTQDEHFFEPFNNEAKLRVGEAKDKEAANPGQVYFAPPNYHLLVERGGALALSVDEKVNHARPSIDVLFESAAHAWAPHLIGVILTGANHDGAQGLRLIRSLGGLTIAQDPATANCSAMPQAAIDAGGVCETVPLEQIGELLIVSAAREK